MRVLFSVFAEKTNGNIEASIDGDFSLNLMSIALKDICLYLIKYQDSLNKAYSNIGALKISSTFDDANFYKPEKEMSEVKIHLKNIAYEEFQNDLKTLKQTLLNFPYILYDEVIFPTEWTIKYCGTILNKLNPATLKEILQLEKDNIEYLYKRILPKIEMTSEVKIDSKGFRLEEIKVLLDKFYSGFPAQLKNIVQIDFLSLTCKSS